ncbi:MAG: pyrroline-5-carboxylate reductase [Epulopiscium sp. Nele67-Bin005]|nr:MAG: pyrroline-5-carboxylate reductase [Epulopiscium sp. Nele67-Bin005]
MIGFIGAGNMGSTMIYAIDNNLSEVGIFDVNFKNYAKFESQNITFFDNVSDLVCNSKYVVLTVKPKYYGEVCEQIKSILTKNHVVVTVAPNIALEDMMNLLGENIKVVRTMPNTPALVGKGVTAYCANDLVENEEIEELKSYFNCFGKVYCVCESNMEAVVAISGSSPAYLYMFIEAMGDAGVKLGLSREEAYEISANAIAGACEMVLQTSKHPAQLKDEVTSPAGTTIEAVCSLEASGFRSSVIEAVTVCYNKAKSM